MYTIFGNCNVELCKEVSKTDTLKLPEIDSWKKTLYVFRFTLRISNNILHIEEANVSKFEFMHTLLESKRISAIKRKAIASWFVKYVAFLLGHPVYQ